MGKSQSTKLIAVLPLVFAATFVVVVAPTLVVFWLRESGAVDSVWVSLAIGVLLSLTASQAGAAIWKAKADSDLLFNELMLWGWVQRFRSERRLAAATDLLGLSVGQPKAITGDHLSSEQKTQLLTQLTTGLEASDPYTHGHSRRVARHAANIAKQMGLSGAEVAKIRAAGAMHDVGKVETPTSVLHKAGRLTDEEFAIVKRHPVDGADMVATLDDPELTAIVRHHHERLDGTGYPDGLAGDEIPLGARILAVADTFDAITSTRPYRQANPHKKALEILETEAGTQLDPDAVRAFLECYSGMKPVAFWAVLINARPRVSASLGQVFSPVTGTNVMATTAAAAAAGAVAVGPGAHTVPAPSKPDAPETAALTSPAPFRGAGHKTTFTASLAADRDAARDRGRARAAGGPKAQAETVDAAGPAPTQDLATGDAPQKAPSTTAPLTPTRQAETPAVQEVQKPTAEPPSRGPARENKPAPVNTGNGNGNGNGNGHGPNRPPVNPGLGHGNGLGNAKGLVDQVKKQVDSVVRLPRGPK